MNTSKMHTTKMSYQAMLTRGQSQIQHDFASKDANRSAHTQAPTLVKKAYELSPENKTIKDTPVTNLFRPSYSNRWTKYMINDTL